MELRNIMTFLRVVEIQNFTHTAEELGYSQSAITVQIKQLETELGVPLFERIGRTVRLTEPGIAFLKEAKSIVEAAERAKEAVNLTQEPKGFIHIGTMESLVSSVFPQILPHFHELYPNVKVVLHTGRFNDLSDMLRSNDVDFIFYIGEKLYFPEWIMPLDQPERTVFVAKIGHPLQDRKNLSLKDLYDYPWVLTEEGEGYRVPLDKKFAEYSLKVTPFLEVGNTDVVARLVSNGMGISLLPMYVVRQYVEDNKLTILDVPDFSSEMRLELAYHRNKWITPTMQKMMNMLIEYTKIEEKDD